MADHHLGNAAWSVADIPYRSLKREVVSHDELLFYVVTSASFLEITSDLYTRNLVEMFRGNDEVVAWLERVWESDELRHGAALKRYVQAAWPDFDWEAAYAEFYGEFVRFCSVDQLASTCALEMVARCVVETGTAAFYRMLMDMSPEPVLRQIASLIQADEVRHYKHFYHYFLDYRARQRPSLVAVLRTLWARSAEVDAEDAYYAFKHVYLARNPGTSFQKNDYAAFRRNFQEMAKRYFPSRMAIKMVLKPIGLNATVGRMVLPAVTAASRLILLH
jgi:hypothetical protein